MVLDIFRGGPNTIKEQQRIHQAAKKITGNTFTARGMPINIFATVVILVGGTAFTINNCYKLYFNVGKIPLEGDD